MLATMGPIAELFGGGATVVGWLLAWYPVAVALATCGIAYALGVRLTGSRSVGVLAAAVLAITPGYVLRTALGFGDHHAFDYLWLAVTALALVVLVTERSPRSRVAAVCVVVLGVSVAAQALAWVGGLLLVVPLGVSLVAVTVSAVLSGRSSLSTGLPLVASLGLASVLTYGATVLLGWQSTGVAAVLALTTAVGLAVVGLPAVVARWNWRTAVGRALAGVGLLLVLVLVTLVGPDVLGIATDGFEFFQRSTGSVAEASSLFAGSAGYVGGPLLMFGPLFLLFLPALLAVTAGVVTDHRPGWLAVVAYAWYFLGLSAVQQRFAGELALFFGVIAAVAVVDVAGRLGVLRGRPTLGRLLDRRAPAALEFDAEVSRRVVTVVAVSCVLIVAGSVVGISVKLDQNTYTKAQYETARWMGTYADEQGLAHDESYVFSSQRTNLMYNYFAGGDARGFGYASQHYFPFLLSRDDEEWADRLGSRGTGFVVVEEGDGQGDTMQSMLHGRLGSGGGTSPGVGRFRALYRSGDGVITVFRPVPGAVVTGTGPPNGTVRVRTNVTITRAAFPYERRARTTADGHYAVRVAYPGAYSDGRREVTVGEADVERGRFAAGRTGEAHWAFEEGRGEVAFDRLGGNHGFVRGATWGDGVEGRGLVLDGDGHVEIPNSSRLDGSDGFTLSVWFRTDPGVDYVNETRFPRIVAKAPSSAYSNTSGYQIAMSRGRVIGAVGDGEEATVLVGPRVDDGKWHRATLTWNWSVSRLFVDGMPVADGRFGGSPTDGQPLHIGSSSTGGAVFRGGIDEVQIESKLESATQFPKSFERAESGNETG